MNMGCVSRLRAVYRCLTVPCIFKSDKAPRGSGISASVGLFEWEQPGRWVSSQGHQQDPPSLTFAS